MRLLQARVDTSVIALWLGHSDVRITQIYLNADRAVDCDDTLFHRDGRQVDGAGVFRDAVRSTVRKVVFARSRTWSCLPCGCTPRGEAAVTSWRDGHMVLCWTVAGMLNAERSFRRIKRYKQMPQLVEALHRHAHPETASGPTPL